MTDPMVIAILKRIVDQVTYLRDEVAILRREVDDAKQKRCRCDNDGR